MIETELAEMLAPWQPVERDDWHFDQVKNHYDIVLGKMLQNTPQSADDIEVPYLKAQHIQWDSVEVNELPTMWASPRDVETLRIKKGDMLVCEGGEVGRAAIVINEPPINCIIQNALHLVRPKATGNKRFLRYLLFHATSHDWLEVICNRATIAHFTSEKFKELWIWIPSVSEQRIIADYLDRETERIDALVKAKERLLVLLDEKRRALITHAVTRGLNPAAPTRDSGIEWLGHIPSHWKVVTLKRLAEVRTGVAKGRNLKKDEAVSVPYLRVANVQDGFIDLSDVAEIEVLPHEIPAFSLKKDDVLMNEGGDADKLGRGAVWDGSIDPCLHQNHVFAVRCYDVEPQWLSTVTSSDFAKAYFESRSKQSTNLASISATNLKELSVPMPPTQERHMIMREVEKIMNKVDALYLATQKTIDLLHERRTALIAAAVTGQIPIPETSWN